MALQGEILVTDSDGSVIQGTRENNSCFIHEFKFAVNKPNEVAGNMHFGIRRVEVFWVVKDIDRLTPSLLEALVQNKELQQVKITLYRIGIEIGEPEPYFEYLLKGARIVSLENWMPPVYDPETVVIGNMEKVGIVAREIEMTDLIHSMMTIVPTYGVE